MPAPQSSPDPSVPHGSRRRLLLLAGGALSGLVLIVALWTVWNAIRLQSFIELNRRAGAEYQRLEREYPFDPKEAAISLRARLKDVLLVRERLHQAIAPELHAAVQGVLENQDFGRLVLARRFLKLEPQFQTLLDRHLKALAQRRMSLKAYRWLLGLLMAEAIERPDRYPVGARYRELIEQVARLTRGNAAPGDDLEAREVYERMKTFYVDAPSPPAQLVDRLQGEQATNLMLDLFAMTTQWIELDIALSRNAVAGSPLP